jgi:hypothetical protein
LTPEHADELAVAELRAVRRAHSGARSASQRTCSNDRR